MSFISAAVLLFFVMDPLGNVPLFLSALRNVEAGRVRAVIIRELLIALLLMVAFLFGGQLLLAALHVSPAALTAGGGVVLLLIALRMIFPGDRGLQEEVYDEPFVVPLAIPYTAGPSVLATELLFMSQEPDRWPIWLAAIGAAWVASAVILYFASGLRRVLGERGLTAIERLMGMVLVMVAVEMLMTGVAEYLAR